MTIIVSTDGSALGNPHGPMGWAWADHGVNGKVSASHPHTSDCAAGGATNGTNQIGELCAVLQALRAHPGSEPLTIETDSQYAINCATTWVRGWKRNGWRNSQKQPVKNAELIKAIDREITNRPGPVNFVWVKGHAGNAGNERVDELARTYAADCRSGAQDGFLPLEGWQALMASPYAQGLDVPADAQLLMDGAITGEQYEQGRPGALVAQHLPQDTAQDMPQDAGEETSDTAQKAADTNDSADAANTIDGTDTADNDIDNSADIADSAANMDSANNADTDDATANTGDAVSTPEEAHDETPQNTADTTTETTSPASDDTTNDDTSDAGQPSTPSATPSAVPSSAQRVSGLTVSGTVTFSPPPSSSPSYDGRPRLVRGVIAVEGYVDGEGRLTLAQAPFLINRS